MNEIDLIRTNPSIDPQLHIWGWEIPVYLFLGGMAAGAMILSASLGKKNNSTWVRLLPFAAPILLSIGMGALFLDLANKLHVYRFYLAFKWSSPMSWGAWILLGIYPVAMLLGVLRLSPSELNWLGNRLRSANVLASIRQFAEEHEGLIRAANIGLGAALGIYTGILLSSTGRPVWNSAILGPLFLASGISAGAALALLFPMKDEEHHFFRRWDMAAIGIELLLILIYLLGLATISGPDGALANEAFLGGKYTAPFWSLVVLGGLLVPFTLKLIESARGLKPTLVAPVLVLCGGFALRWILVYAGQA
ncbi:MAG: hypothetical protein A2X94_01905 [Bdellovibrionales bacterium GWB1_55_8]|nr:MAG: hypothetical protein A2X94_01905 [Bdellovibrionales bacterium GWB1_55_8]